MTAHREVPLAIDNTGLASHGVFFMFSRRRVKGRALGGSARAAA